MPTDIPAASAAPSPFLFPAEWQALSDILGASSAGLLLLREGKISHLSGHLADLLGFDAAELAGQPVESLLLAANTDDMHVRLASKSGRPIDFRRTIHRANTLDDAHCTIWVLQSTAPQTTSDDNAHRFAIVEHLPEPALVCTPDTRLRYANQSFRDLLGGDRDAFDSVRLIDLAHAEDRPKLQAALAQASDESTPGFTFRMRDRNGSWRHIETLARTLPAHLGSGLLLCGRDVTDQYQQQRDAAAEKKRQLHYVNRLFRLARYPHANFTSTLKTILKSSAKALGAHRCAYWEFDEDPAATRCVMAYDDIRQSLVHEATNAVFATSFHPLLRKVRLSEQVFLAANVDQDPRAAPSCEYFHAAGIKSVMIAPVPCADQAAGLLIVSESRQARNWGNDEAEFTSHAGELISRALLEIERGRSATRRDGSTEAPHPDLPLKQADDVLPQVVAGANAFAAFFIGLDDFGHVNDSLGSALGDELRKAAALRLKNIARKDDVLLPLDGNAFMLLARGLSERRAADDLARQIDETLRDTFFLQGHELRISASVGTALYPSDGVDIDTLMRKADRRSGMPGQPASFNA